MQANEQRSMKAINAAALLLLLVSLPPRAASQLCDDNPLANNGVKISFQASSSCLKGRTRDMTEIGTCKDDAFYDIGLPFAFNFLGRAYGGSGNGRIFASSNSYVTFGGNSFLFMSAAHCMHRVPLEHALQCVSSQSFCAVPVHRLERSIMDTIFVSCSQVRACVSPGNSS